MKSVFTFYVRNSRAEIL